MEFDLCPRSVLSRLGVPARLQRDVSILVSSLLVFAVLPVIGYIPHFCLMRTLLHMPCPGCGVTRAMTAACQFNLAQAWGFNPGGMALAVFLALEVVLRPAGFLWSKLRPAIDRFSRYGSSAVLASLFMVWIYRLYFNLL